MLKAQTQNIKTILVKKVDFIKLYNKSNNWNDKNNNEFNKILNIPQKIRDSHHKDLKV